MIRPRAVVRFSWWKRLPRWARIIAVIAAIYLATPWAIRLTVAYWRIALGPYTPLMIETLMPRS